MPTRMNHVAKINHHIQPWHRARRPSHREVRATDAEGDPGRVSEFLQRTHDGESGLTLINIGRSEETAASGRRTAGA
jgi:hypothetical protein